MKKIILDRIIEAEKNLSILKSADFINQISNAAKICINSLNNGGKILFCGNGGSASDAAHLSAELVGRYLSNRKPYASVCLSSNLSLLTAIANDYGYDNIFSRQIEAIGKKDDILFVISTSGKSKNILKAINTGKKKKLKIIFLNSIKNKKVKKICNFDIKVPAHRIDQIQELHIMIGHLICEIIERQIK